MNIPIAVADENGTFNKMVVSSDFLKDIAETLRTEGVSPIHTIDDKGNKKTYNAHAIVLMAKGSTHSVLVIPQD